MTTPLQFNIPQETTVQPLKGVTLAPATSNVNSGTEFENSTLWVNSADGHMYKGNSDLQAPNTYATFTATATLRNTSAVGGSVLGLGVGPEGFGLYAPKLYYDWAVSGGGGGAETGAPIAVDQNGNVFVGLVLNTAGFPATFGSSTFTTLGSTDAIVAKISPTGTWLWAVQVGGVSSDIIRSVTTDTTGNVYICGYFTASVTFGATTLTATGSNDVYVAKLDTNGNWIWAVKGGGTSGDTAMSIHVDPQGYIYIAGDFLGSATFGSTTLTSSGVTDPYVAKLDTNGSWLWAVKGSGTSTELTWQAAIDSQGNVYVVGYTTSNMTFGAYTVINPGNQSVVVAKCNTNGVWLWAVNGGGTSNDQGLGITSDAYGNCYIAGTFQGTATFGKSVFISASGDDLFVAKLDTNGNWIWAVKQGSLGGDSARGIAVDQLGSVYVTGQAASSFSFGGVFPVVFGAYLAKLDNGGNWLWAHNLGSNPNNFAYSLVVDAVGALYICGSFQGSSTFDDLSIVSAGGQDIFAVKVTPAFQQLIVVVNEPGNIGDTVSISYGGVVNSFSSLVAGSLYWYNAYLKSVTSTPTPYKVGYALDANTMLLEISPKFLV